MPTLDRESDAGGLELARVLVVDDNPTSRLTLETVLRAGGYGVDSAASAAEAVGKLDEHEYSLVLSDSQMESPEAGLRLLAYAQSLEYQPAIALIEAESQGETDGTRSSMLVAPQDIPGLLGTVANLIAERVSKRIRRRLRQSKN